MKKTPFLLLLMLILGFYSCSDDTVSSGKSKYINGNIDSYWIYENFPVDIQQGVIADSSFIDSTYISAKVNVLNKDCSVYTTDNYEDDEISSTTEMYLREEDEKIYTHSGFVTNAFDNLPIDLPFELEEKWIKIADFNDDLWLVYEMEIDTVTVPFIGAKLVGEIKVMGSKEGNESIVISGNNHNAQQFQLEIVFTGTIIFNGLPIAFNPERTVDLWFVENIGMVKTYEHPSAIAIPYLGDMPIDGNERVLLRYIIK
jgi:hypothetical protein